MKLLGHSLLIARRATTSSFVTRHSSLYFIYNFVIRNS